MRGRARNLSMDEITSDLPTTSDLRDVNAACSKYLARRGVMPPDLLKPSRYRYISREVQDQRWLDELKLRHVIRAR
jgi:hypothetical protein